jgi:hypothetical protein
MSQSRVRFALSLLTLAAALAAPAFADPDDESDWAKYVPPATTPGSVLPPNTAEGGFGAPDRTRLDQQLKRGVLDQACRQAQLPINYNFGSGDFSGTGVGVNRFLRADADNTVVLIDEEKVHVSFAHSFAKAVGDETGLSVGFGMGASIDGRSMVVRRTGTKQSCDEVKRLADFRDAKTVLPASARRISEMGLGELWRVPFSLTYTQGLSAGDSNPDGAAVSVSFGRSDNGTASMTLYRIADDKTRFRFRIDHVVVHSKSLGLTEIYPGVLYAANATNILLKFVENAAANQLGRYTSAWLTFGRANSDGKKILMEFVVDPRDPAQAEALAKAMRGDFEELVKFSYRMTTLQVADTMKDYLSLRERDASMLGPSTYAASDEYTAKARSFSIRLPFLVQHNAASLFGDDKVHRYTDAGGEFRFFRADSSKNNDYFNVPFVGPIVKDSAQRDVEAVTYAPKDGVSGDPIVVYIRNEGYFRVPGSAVREPITELNRVLSAAGAQRGDDAGRLKLPIDSLVPPPAPLSEAARSGRDGNQPTEPSDRKGTLSFTLVMNQKAVRDILAAPSDAVLRAFAASLDAVDKPMMNWLIANGARGGNNEIGYDWNAARRAFPQDSGREPASDPGSSIAKLSRDAAAFLNDLAAARDAKNNEERAQALATMIGGKGRSDRSYEDSLRVLVQLVDPMDLSGDFVSNVQSSSKDVKSASNHLVLKKDRAEVPLLKEAGDAKARFSQPSILTD